MYLSGSYISLLDLILVDLILISNTFETFCLFWMIVDSVSILIPSHTQCSCPLPRTRLEQWEPNKILLTAHNPLIPCFKGTRRPTFSVNTQTKTVTLLKVRNSLRVHQDYKKDSSYHGNWLQMAAVGGCRSRSVPSLTLQGSENLTLTQTQNFQLSLWLSVENTQTRSNAKNRNNESKILIIDMESETCLI